MSTRAIAPIVGAGVMTVHDDLARVRNRTPEPVRATDSRPDAPQYEDYRELPDVTFDVDPGTGEVTVTFTRWLVSGLPTSSLRWAPFSAPVNARRIYCWLWSFHSVVRDPAAA